MSDNTYKALFEGFQTALAAGAAGPEVIFSVESRQVAGLKSEAKIREFTLTIDEPEQLGGANQGPNPVEVALASLATCQEITYRLYADALGIPLNGVSVSVRGTLDLRGFFAVDDKVRPGFQGIETEVTFDSPASDAELERLKTTVDQHCPVLDLLTKATPVSLSWSRQAAAAAEA